MLALEHSLAVVGVCSPTTGVCAHAVGGQTPTAAVKAERGIMQFL